MRVTEAQAAASVERAWPHAVQRVALEVRIIEGAQTTDDTRFAQAVRLTLAADQGRIADDWTTEKLVWLATEGVPGLLEDLREAQVLVGRMSADGFAVMRTTSRPAISSRVLRAFFALDGG